MKRWAAIVAALALATTACGDDEPDEPRASRRSGDLTIVSLNVLHGAFCPPETEGCRAADRLDLFLDQIGTACPDVVALQEIDTRWLGLVEARSGDVCGGRYERVWHGTGGVDRELVLSALPVLDSELRMLAGGLRSAFWVRVRSGLGPVDLVVTHLASSDNAPCDAERCPPPCSPDGDTRTCQATQVAEFVADRRSAGGVAVVAGDLNDVAGSAAVDALTGRGLQDSHLRAGNPECDAATGARCTSGRHDRDLTDLSDPSARQTERIDYVLVDPPPGCEPAWDSGTDADGDGVPTGLFRPGPADPPGPGGLVFTSDHTAVALDLACG